MVEHYADFVNFARKMGANDYAQDLVQELFIHINGRPNTTKSYCLTWLQWRSLDLYKQKKRITKVEIENNLVTFDTPYEVDLFKNVHWFHKGVFDLWANGMSIREIAKETKLSIGTVRKSIEKIKNIWHEKSDK